MGVGFQDNSEQINEDKKLREDLDRHFKGDERMTNAVIEILAEILDHEFHELINSVEFRGGGTTLNFEINSSIYLKIPLLAHSQTGGIVPKTNEIVRTEAAFNWVFGRIFSSSDIPIYPISLIEDQDYLDRNPDSERIVHASIKENLRSIDIEIDGSALSINYMLMHTAPGTPLMEVEDARRESALSVYIDAYDYAHYEGLGFPDLDIDRSLYIDEEGNLIVIDLASTVVPKEDRPIEGKPGKKEVVLARKLLNGAGIVEHLATTGLTSSILSSWMHPFPKLARDKLIRVTDTLNCFIQILDFKLSYSWFSKLLDTQNIEYSVAEFMKKFQDDSITPRLLFLEAKGGAIVKAIESLMDEVYTKSDESVLKHITELDHPSAKSVITFLGLLQFISDQDNPASLLNDIVDELKVGAEKYFLSESSQNASV